MHEDEIARRVARYERALITIASGKPDGSALTEADHERAAQVVSMVERYEAAQRTRRPPASPDAPDAPTPTRPRRKRPRRRRTPSAPAAPRPRGRPRKAPEPPPG